jgi:lipoprotein-anchoring transpeptidase ErfK/SrfK
MHLKLKRTPSWRKWSLFFIVPLIVLSLAHCQEENSTSSTIGILPKMEPLVEKTTDINPVTQTIQPCTKPFLDSRIEVAILEQQLYLYCRYSNREEVKSYPISTSKYGIGNQAGSNKTPLGLHQIENKIGNGAPEGMIFKARQATGRIAEMNVEGAGDLVTSRILWLKGLEPGNNRGRGIDSYQRYIYIHGTPEENKIGRPASHGCIRMYNRDVIDLFDLILEGAEVYIRE